MKKLFESWNKFLKEDINQNYHKLLSLTTQDGKNVMEKFDLSLEILKQLVNQIKPLKNNTITGILGAGSFGIAYSLSNDHVLKIFSHGLEVDPNGKKIVGSAEGDIKKYQDMQNRQFQGKSHKGEPAIYDIGSANVNDPEFGNANLYYVELGKVIPILDWLEMSKMKSSYFHQLIKRFQFFIAFRDLRKQKEKIPQNKQDSSDFAKANTHIINPDQETYIGDKTKKDNLDERQENSRGFIKEFYLFLQETSSESINWIKFFDQGIPRQIQIEFLTGLKRYMDITGEIKDLHLGNFGVILNKDPKNPVSFVFFDI